MLVGYARTSTVEQLAGLEAQLRDLDQAGVEKVFREQVSSIARREQLTIAMDWVREGDTLVVTRLDRLVRSTADLLRIIEALEAKTVALRILDFGGAPIDTRSPSGRLVVTLLGAVAEFERLLMLERQREGIAKAKAAGRYRGRAPTARAKALQVHELRAKGVRPSDIATELRVSRASVYRILQAKTARSDAPKNGLY